MILQDGMPVKVTGAFREGAHRRTGVLLRFDSQTVAPMTG